MNVTIPINDVAARRAKFDELTSGGNQRTARLKMAIFGRLYLLSPVRALLPSFTLRGTTYLLGYDDVRSVLCNEDVFATPFHDTMAALDRTGAVSLLGFETANAGPDQRLANDEAYRRNLCQIMRCLLAEDLPRLSVRAARAADDIVRGAHELDVVGGLLTPIALDIAQHYFGVAFAEPRQFHRWTMAISNYTFGGAPSVQPAAALGAALVDEELDRAIASARLAAPPPDTILGRLVRFASPCGAPQMTDDQIRATVAGLLSGMLPNLPTAGLNVLRLFMSNPRAMAAAQAAAMDDDDDLLQRCIMEALRFRPIDPGRKRVCAAPDGGRINWRRGPIPVGRKIFAATLPAMFDGRRVRKPFRFDPARPLSDNLALGTGKHWCVGAPIALSLLTQVLKPLLRRKRIRPEAGASTATYFLGFFPERFILELE